MQKNIYSSGFRRHRHGRLDHITFIGSFQPQKSYSWRSRFFCINSRNGDFALEVKGGRVRRQNGIWSFTDKYGHTDTKERGPFDQAWEGIYSLKESISKMLDTEHRGLKILYLA